MMRPLLLAVFAVCSAQVSAAACPDYLRSQAEKNEQIIQSNSFNVTRDLEEYYSYLPGLQNELSTLGKDSVWLDGGSGEGLFFLDYLINCLRNNGSCARLIATGIERPNYSRTLETLENTSAKLSLQPYRRAMLLKLLEFKNTVEMPTKLLAEIQEKVTNNDYAWIEAFLKSIEMLPPKGLPVFHALYGSPIEEISVQAVGKVDLVTDVYGAFSYSTRPDLVIRKYAEILKPNGRIYIFLDHGFRSESPAGYQFSTLYLQNSDALQWLKSIGGLRIVGGLTPRASEYGFRVPVILERTGEPIRVPELALKNMETSKPPKRAFRMSR